MFAPSKKKFASWDIYSLIFFIIMISTAFILWFIQRDSAKNLAENNLMNQNKNILEDFKKKDKNVNVFKNGRIILSPKNNISAEGYAAVSAVSGDGTYNLLGYFRLPKIENGYAYSAWLYKNDLQEYKRLSNLSEISQNIYFIEYSFGQYLIDFHDIVILLSLEGEDPSSGTLVLQGSLKE